MAHQFYAKGKLLLTSEFMILHGAKALAMPLKKGQSLHLTPKTKPRVLHWKAEFEAVTWFDTKIDLQEFKIIDSSNLPKAENLLFILKKTIEIQPSFIEQLQKYDVLTKLEFDPVYGFGSSSTLTSLLALWAEIDPMQLHFRISRGSGYDIVCAQAKSAVLYKLINEMPVTESVDFNPDFADKLWFAYLGHKQDSAKSVAAFLENYTPKQEDIKLFSDLTCGLLKANDLDEFGQLIIQHEQKLSEILGIQPIQKKLFPELQGYAKSLGAWGGDFVLVATEWPRERLEDYLYSKGIDQWYSYNELIY